MTARFAMVFASISGALAVGAGAFGAHALKTRLSPEDLVIWETAARYQLIHAVVLLFAAQLIGRQVPGSNWAVWGFVVGTVIFSGSLYTLVLTDQRWMGAITPIGGVALIAGWIALARVGLTLVD